MKKLLLSVMTMTTMVASSMSAAITEPVTLWEKNKPCTVEGIEGDGNCISNWGTALELPGSAFEGVEDGCIIEFTYAIGSGSGVKFVYFRHPVYNENDNGLGFSNDPKLLEAGLSDKDIIKNEDLLECQNEMNRRIYTVRAFIPAEKMADLKKFGCIIKGGKGDGTGAMPFYVWQVNLIPVSSDTSYPENWYVSEVDLNDDDIVESWDVDFTTNWGESVKFKKEAFDGLETPIWLEVNYSILWDKANEKYVNLRIPNDESLYADQDVQTKRFITRSNGKTLNYIPLANVNLLKEHGLVIKSGNGQGDNAPSCITVHSVKIIVVGDDDAINDVWKGYLECDNNEDPNVPANMLSTLGSSIARQLQTGDELRIYYKNSREDNDVEEINLYYQNNDMWEDWNWYPAMDFSKKSDDGSYFSIPVTDDLRSEIGEKPNSLGVGNSGLSLYRVSLIQKDSSSGIETIEAADENAPVEYYNLQGMKVKEPSNGVYIKKQGTKVEKIVTKR